VCRWLPTDRLTGVILADQVKRLDRRERRADFVEEAASTTLRSTRMLVAKLLDFGPT